MFPVGSRSRNRGRGFAFNRGAKVPPSFVFDFLRGSLDSRITYTGANGTLFNSSGTLTAATTNVPRLDYNPATLVARGLLIEEARTNICLQSADFGTTWTLFNSTVAVDQVAAPTGATTADKLKEDNATAVHYSSQNVTITAAATYTVSLFAKQAENRYLQIGFDSGSANGGYATFDLQTGTVTQSANKGTGSGIVASIQAINNSWYRLIVTTVVDAASTSGRMFVVLSNSGTPGFAPSYLGVTGNGVYVWGAQIEAGAFATSYIATTTVAVTRAADVASITGANFTSFWNATQGTIVVRATQPTLTGGVPTLYSADSTASAFTERVLGFLNSSTPETRVTTGGVEQATLSLTGTITAGTQFAVAQAYKANDFASVKNGGTVFTDTSGTLPTVDRMEIGSIGGLNLFNGWISSLSYYPVRLPDSELRSLSA